MNDDGQSLIGTDCIPENRVQSVDCKYCSIRDRMLFADVDVDAAAALLKLRWLCQSYRLHQGPERHRPDPGSSSREGTGHPYPPVAHTSYQGTT